MMTPECSANFTAGSLPFIRDIRVIRVIRG